MKKRIKVWKDPLAECDPHKFSEIFVEGGPELDSDFTVWVRRMGHSAIRNESMARMRSGEFDPKRFQHVADPETGEINLDDLSTEEFVELVGQSEWMTPLLIADIQDLRVEDESGEPEVVKSLRESYPDEFEEIVAGLLSARRSWSGRATSRTSGSPT